MKSILGTDTVNNAISRETGIQPDEAAAIRRRLANKNHPSVNYYTSVASEMMMHSVRKLQEQFDGDGVTNVPAPILIRVTAHSNIPNGAETRKQVEQSNLESAFIRRGQLFSHSSLENFVRY